MSPQKTAAEKDRGDGKGRAQRRRTWCGHGFTRRSRESSHVRDHLASRRRQDDADREAPALRRGDRDGRAGRRAPPSAGRHLGLDGAGAGARASRSPRRCCSSPTTAARSTSSTRPGHQDFGEDTYRTLLAADSAVMLIDAAKGRRTADPQVVCDLPRSRGIPLFTFVNKLDRPTRDPLELLDELENVLGIGAYPVNWPLGNGETFRGVYDRDDAGPARVRTHRARGQARAGHRRRRATTSGFAGSSTRARTRLHRRPRPARRRGRGVRRRGDAARRRHAGVLRQRDDQLRRRAVPGAVRRAGAAAGSRGPMRNGRRSSRPTSASRRSCSRSKRTWIRATATASPSPASARAVSSAT